MNAHYSDYLRQSLLLIRWLVLFEAIRFAHRFPRRPQIYSGIVMCETQQRYTKNDWIAPISFPFGFLFVDLPFQSRFPPKKNRRHAAPSIFSFILRPVLFLSCQIMWITIDGLCYLPTRRTANAIPFLIPFFYFIFLFFRLRVLAASPKRPEPRRVTKLKRRKAYYRHKKDVSLPNNSLVFFCCCCFFCIWFRFAPAISLVFAAKKMRFNDSRN